MIRVSQPGSFIVITVWRFFQPKFMKIFRQQLNTDWESRSFELGDISLPWTLQDQSTHHRLSTKIDRFYHLFRAQEFINLVKPFNLITLQAIGNYESKDNFFYFGYKSL